MFRYIATMVLTQIAWWIILITAKYPKSWHEFNVGTLRWAARIQLYFGFMSDKYPPFSGLAEKDAVDSGKISEKKATENKPAAAKPESKIATAATPPPTPVKATPAPAVPKPEPEKPAVSTASKPIAVPASPKAENKPVQATTLAKDKEKSKKRPLLWMILTGIFLLASGLLGWQYFDLSGKIKHYMEAEKTWNEEKAVWENEKNGLLEQISNLNQENELLIAKMNDPMKNEKLRSIMEENAKLGERVKQLQASGGGDGGWKYKKEIESLKKQLEDLNAQLSALNGQNAQLSQEKSKLETDLGSEKNKTSQLKKDNDEMKKKMDEAKRLVIDDLVTGGVKLKRGGKKIVSLNKAKSSDKIQVCFSIGRNTLSDPGKRDFYIIITAPGNKVLGKESNTFDIDNSQKQYSIKQTEDYKNQEKLVCAYFEKAKEEKFATGKYSVEIYTEGNKVGESSFELK
jgi:predicted nuclease with TOPRIM domain